MLSESRGYDQFNSGLAFLAIISVNERFLFWELRGFAVRKTKLRISVQLPSLRA